MDTLAPGWGLPGSVGGKADYKNRKSKIILLDPSVEMKLLILIQPEI